MKPKKYTDLKDLQTIQLENTFHNEEQEHGYDTPSHQTENREELQPTTDNTRIERITQYPQNAETSNTIKN